MCVVSNPDHQLTYQGDDDQCDSMLGRDGWDLETYAREHQPAPILSWTDFKHSRFSKTCGCVDKDVISLHDLDTDFQLPIAELIETPVYPAQLMPKG